MGKIINKRPPKIKSMTEPNSRYIKVLSTESVDRFNEMGELINQKKVKWSFYKIENSIGIHYYLKLKS
jgi:hypothetical protein